MENPSIVRNGGIKLPVGYRFLPTDEELIVHYLNRKAHSLPLPVQVIPELNVFQTNPWDLPGDFREKRFFFWKRKGKWRKSRGRTESGYWKAMGKEKHVVGFESNQAIGVKKSFVFYQGNRPNGLRTQWVMREYGLLESQTRPKAADHKFVRKMENDWVVCKIYQNKRKSNKNAVKTDLICNSKEILSSSVGEIRPTVLDINDLGPPQPSSSSLCSSSGVACEGDEAAADEEEITSSYISFFA